MALFDLRRQDSLAHAGTFNNNVLTMAAGCAGIEHVFTPKQAEELHARGERLRKRLQMECARTTLQWTGMGSILCVHFTTVPAFNIASPGDVADADMTLSGLFHLCLLDHGYYIGRRGFLALSLAITDYQLDGFVTAVSTFIAELRPLLAMN